MKISNKGLFDTVEEPGSEIALDLTNVPPGVHSDDNVFFRVGDDLCVTWVVSRICDHANGKLRLSPDNCTAVCPLHGWRLSLKSLNYENVQVKKTQLPFRQVERKLFYTLPRAHLEFPASLDLTKPATATVRFLAHACVEIRTGSLSIVTDPWLVGPCFTTGWWHSSPPPADALDVLHKADVIYLSHNHPDHMHMETLKGVDRSTPLLVPAFESGSVERMARNEGFININVLELGRIYQIGEEPVYVSILPAGDFRDDSGLVIAYGDFSAVLTVDSNRLNQYILPQKPSVLLTSFAGGASGYPLCFEIYSEIQKSKMLVRNRNAMLAGIEQYIEATRPHAYIPYAGYFKEAAPRDRYVKENNKKNDPATVQEYFRQHMPSLTVIDPTITDLISWEDGKIAAESSGKSPLMKIDEDFIAHWIKRIDMPNGCTTDMIVEYFRRSHFRDDLRVFLVPTDEDFRPADRDGFIIDFRTGFPAVEVAPATEIDTRYLKDCAEQLSGDPHLKRIRVRAGSLYRVIADGLSWEDISIGFQCRIHRSPDVYNSDFWFHFTNVFVGTPAAARTFRLNDMPR